MDMSSLEVQSTLDGSFCTHPGASSAADKGAFASLPVKWASLDNGDLKVTFVQSYACTKLGEFPAESRDL